jgi:hypothetical protein
MINDLKTAVHTLLPLIQMRQQRGELPRGACSSSTSSIATETAHTTS